MSKAIQLITVMFLTVSCSCPVYTVIGQPTDKTGKPSTGHFDILYKGKDLTKAVRSLESDKHTNKGFISK